MKCKEINKLLFLNEIGLTVLELEATKKHISGCARCQKELVLISKSNALISKIKEHVPLLADEEEFADSVMASLEKDLQPGGRSFIDLILDKVSLFFLNTAVRAAAVSVILILVSTFIIQQYFVFSNVENLENKLAVTEVNSVQTADIGFSRVKLIKLTTELFNLASGNNFYAELSKGLILADKARLNELLTLYSNLQNYKNLYTAEIKENYPELNTFLSGRLSIEELQDFVKKNENMIKEISRNFPAGGK